jgi:hypothetical protein
MLFSFFFNEERDVDDCPPSFPSSFYLRADLAGGCFQHPAAKLRGFRVRLDRLRSFFNADEEVAV